MGVREYLKVPIVSQIRLRRKQRLRSRPPTSILSKLSTFKYNWTMSEWHLDPAEFPGLTVEQVDDLERLARETGRRINESRNDKNRGNMSNEPIPAEAVEAAIRTMPEYTPEDEADSFERETNEQCRAKVERILEAAAPFIEKTAYERGWGAGFRHRKGISE